MIQFGRCNLGDAIERRRDRARIARGEAKHCPRCRAVIDAGATKCQVCQADLDWRRIVGFWSLCSAVLLTLISILLLSVDRVRTILLERRPPSIIPIAFEEGDSADTDYLHVFIDNSSPSARLITFEEAQVVAQKDGAFFALTFRIDRELEVAPANTGVSKRLILRTGYLSEPETGERISDCPVFAKFYSPDVEGLERPDWVREYDSKLAAPDTTGTRFKLFFEDRPDEYPEYGYGLCNIATSYHDGKRPARNDVSALCNIEVTWNFFDLDGCI